MLDNSRPDLAWLSDTTRSKFLKVSARLPVAPTSGLAFFAPDFSLRELNPWIVGEEISVEPSFSQSKPKIVHRTKPEAVDFFRAHADILRRIADGEFKKVVPIVAEQVEFSEDLQASSLIRKPQKGFYSYGYGLGQEGMGGLTPELLFEVEDGILSTMALAGTAFSNAPSLLEDAKERDEHGIVVQHLTDELKTFGEVSVGPTGEKNYGMLKHLLTPISVQLNRMPSFNEIVRRLHPTAALGGWPRAEALSWLSAEPSAKWRGKFGAPFGFTDGECMKCVVAIRGLQWTGRRALLASGCGVVASSVAEKEWQELQLKRDSTLKQLGLS